MDIKTIMTTQLCCISESDTLQEAARLMWECDCGVLPVLNGKEELIGMITDRDIAMSAYTQCQAMTEIKVQNAMSKDVASCKENDDIAKAMEIMQSQQVRRLPVVNKQKKLVGILSLNDIAVTYKQGKGKLIKASDVADTLAAVCTPRKPSATSNVA